MRGLTKEHTPKGFVVVKHDDGPFSPGDTVEVVCRRCTLDWPFKGTTGTFLGWSVPHGFAVVAHGDTEDCFHPESLEVRA